MSGFVAIVDWNVKLNEKPWNCRKGNHTLRKARAEKRRIEFFSHSVHHTVWTRVNNFIYCLYKVAWFSIHECNFIIQLFICIKKTARTFIQWISYENINYEIIGFINHHLRINSALFSSFLANCMQNHHNLIYVKSLKQICFMYE